MRLIRLTTNYPSYLQRFYARQPDLMQASYQQQYRALMADHFSWVDVWAQALAPCGYTVWDLIGNAQPLQTAWARENQIAYSRSGWLAEIATAQIQAFQPDILFIDDHLAYPAAWIAALRQRCPSIRLVIGWCSIPLTDSAPFQAYDLVLSCIPELVEQLRQLGHQSEHLHHAFDQRILQQLDDNQEQAIACCFIGQIVRTSQFHLEREQLLESLVPHLPLQIYSPSAETTWQQVLKAQLKGLLTGRDHRPVSPRLKPYLRPPVFGLEMYRTLQRSQVSLNQHIRVSPRSASNMRLFEATGAGTCLVTDWKANLADLFEPDREVVTYRSAEECVEKVQWLLDHPQARAAIAQAGQARTLRDHSFHQRALQLDAILQGYLRS